MFFINDEEKETILDFSQEIVRARFPLRGDPPTTLKIGLYHHMSPHCFAPNMLMLYFLCSFWPFYPNCPPTSQPELRNPGIVNLFYFTKMSI